MVNKIIFHCLSDNARQAVMHYVESINKPSLADKIKLTAAKAIIRKQTKGFSIPSMVCEEYDDINFLWISLDVKEDYLMYADNLIERARLSYLALFNKYGASEEFFRIEVC